MQQQEYIDVSDRVKILNALQILDGIDPEQSSIITPSELQHVQTALRYWEEKLFKTKPGNSPVRFAAEITIDCKGAAGRGKTDMPFSSFKLEAQLFK